MSNLDVLNDETHTENSEIFIQKEKECMASLWVKQRSKLFFFTHERCHTLHDTYFATSL